MIYNSLEHLETNFVEQKELLKFLKITSPHLKITHYGSVISETFLGLVINISNNKMTIILLQCLNKCHIFHSAGPWTESRWISISMLQWLLSAPLIIFSNVNNLDSKYLFVPINYVAQRNEQWKRSFPLFQTWKCIPSWNYFKELHDFQHKSSTEFPYSSKENEMAMKSVIR